MATVEKMPMLQMGYDKLNAQLRALYDHELLSLIEVRARCVEVGRGAQ